MGETDLIYLVRHGRIDAGPEKRYIGWTDLPLAPEGRAQAEALGRYFSEIPLARIVASDLKRTQETSFALRGANGPLVEIESAFREVHMGEWEGLTFSKARERFPEESRARDHDPVRHRPPGGESFADLKNRVVPAFGRLLDETKGPLALVTHLGVIRVLLLHVLDAPLSSVFRMDQAYGAFSILKPTPSGLRILAMNVHEQSG